jgi:hypothetical protein
MDEQHGGTPQWVKVFGAIAVVLLVLAAVLLLTGGHGPGRHAVAAEPAQVVAALTRGG